MSHNKPSAKPINTAAHKRLSHNSRRPCANQADRALPLPV